jgi:hypothetical protein
MPFTIKTTFSFAGLEQGWSEDFYWQQGTDDLSVAETTVTPLAQKRAKLLSKGYFLTVVRNAVVRDNAGVKVKRVTDLFEPRLPGVQAWADAEPNISLMCVKQTGDNKASAKLYMRGVPAGIADNGKTPNMAFGAFLSNFNAWRSAMIGLPSGWLAGTVTSTAAINSYAIDAASGIVTFTLQAPGIAWPVAPGFKVRVNIQLPGKSPLDGGQVVVVTDGTHCFSAKPIGVHPYIPGTLGVMTLKTPNFISLGPIGGQGASGQIHPQRMVTHKTGRPSYASRGW